MSDPPAPIRDPVRGPFQDLIAPPGMVYEAITTDFFGWPSFAARWAEIEKTGWRRVPQERHPDVPMEQDGFILVENTAPHVSALYADNFATDRAQKNPKGMVYTLHPFLAEGMTAVFAPPEMSFVATDDGWVPNPKYRDPKSS